MKRGFEEGERDTTAIELVWAGVFASPERSTKRASEVEVGNRFRLR